MNTLKKSPFYNNKIAITTSSFAEYDDKPLKLLRESEFGVLINPHKRRLEKNETLELCLECIGIIAGTELYDDNLLRQLKNLKVISRCGVGLDTIDLRTAEALGIKVVNTPNGSTLAVAELTVAFILDLLRKVSFMHLSVKDRKWQKKMGNLLKDKKIGIVGFGRIGQKVAQLLMPFGCTVAYCDLYLKDGIPGFSSLPLEELLGWSDIVSVHVSGNNTIIGAKEINLMKRGSWLINTSRGKSVDEEALYNSLKSRCLQGAALDVFTQEPYCGKLLELDNVILTPHIGSYAVETRVEMEREAVVNLLKELELRGRGR